MGLVEHARDIQFGNAVIDDDVDRLSGEVAHDREAFETTAAVERVHHEIHRPDLPAGSPAIVT
jgi:hypothetical protein